MSEQSFVKMAWLFALLGLGLLLACAYFYRADRRLEANGALTSGTVIDFKEGIAYRKPAAPNRDSDPDNRYEFRYPVVNFVTDDGQTVRVTALRHYDTDDLDLGDRVDVVYLRNDPTQADIKGTRRLSDGTWVTGIAGMLSLLPLLLGVLLPRLLKRWRLP